MPPAVETSEDESSIGEEIPHSEPKPKSEIANGKLSSRAKSEPSDNEEDDEVEEGDEDEKNADDGEFEVEKIITHKFQGKTLLLEVKWKGWDNPADNTFEPEENVLNGAEAILRRYYDNVGGRPSPNGKANAKNKRELSSANGTPESSASGARKRSRKSENQISPDAEAPTEIQFTKPDWFPPDHKSWEKEVESIDTIERQGESGKLCVYLNWRNGRKSKADIDQCYEKCPRKMLSFYESHLVFKVS